MTSDRWPWNYANWNHGTLWKKQLRIEIRPVTALKMWRFFKHSVLWQTNIFQIAVPLPLFTLFYHVFFVEITNMLSEGGTRGSGILTIQNHFLSFFLPPEFLIGQPIFLYSHMTLEIFVCFKREKKGILQLDKHLNKRRWQFPLLYKILYCYLIFQHERNKAVSVATLPARETHYQRHSTWCEQVGMKQLKLKC